MPQWVIQWYDWLLFLSGGKLYATSDLVFYANWTLKLLNALAYLLMMFGDSVAPSVFNYNEDVSRAVVSRQMNALLRTRILCHTHILWRTSDRAPGRLYQRCR